MGFLEERDFSKLPSIPEFYKGKTIFITGGSGFMGKVLIEKLLYSCSDLDRIYLLMRNKKGVKPEDRVAQIYSSECFSRLKKEKPTLFESKVFIVSGDVMEVGLGLSVEDRALLVNRVDIVFHAAASVRFDDPLKMAVKLNLRGTVELMELAKEMKNLCALVHVSTSYSNTNRAVIDEVLYPPLADWRDTLQVCDTLDDHTMKVLTSKYVGEMPNTYTFTKHLAEHAINEFRGQVPVVIVRPSIVISGLEEPLPGWLDNFNGPCGLMVAMAKGILRCVCSSPELKMDYIPVDVSIKSLVTAAWIRGTKKLENGDDVPIYHSCMDAETRFTMKNIMIMGRKVVKKIPVDNAIWTPTGNIISSFWVYYIHILLFHFLPAVFIDTLLSLLGKKPLLVKIQRRIFIATLALRYFMTKEWTFMNNNLVKMRSCIKHEDKEQFYFQLKFTNKFEFLENSAKAGRLYLLKEKEEDIPKALAHNNRLWVVDKVVKFVFYACLFRFLYYNIIANCLGNINELLFN